MLDFLQKKIKEIKKENRKAEIIFAGDSAGASICLALTQLKGMKKIKRNVAISPIVEKPILTPLMRKIVEEDTLLNLPAINTIFEKLAGNHDERDPFLAPINGNYKKVKILLICGTRDMASPGSKKFARVHADSTEYHEYEGYPHIFPLLPIDKAEEAIELIYNFINN
jgi:acetyl esterase/lipase